MVFLGLKLYRGGECLFCSVFMVVSSRFSMYVILLDPFIRIGYIVSLLIFVILDIIILNFVFFFKFFSCFWLFFVILDIFVIFKLRLKSILLEELL